MKKRIFFLLIVFILLSCVATVSAMTQVEKDAALNQLQERIARLTTRIADLVRLLGQTQTTTSGVGRPITIISPQDITYTAGQTYNITWISTREGFIKIEYAGENQRSTITTSIPIARGGYSWTVPNNFLPGRYTMSFSVSADGSTDAISMFNVIAPSIQSTSQPTITINSPKNIDCTIGQVCNIVWASNGVSNLKIDVAVGSNRSTIIASIPASQGSYSWTIPSSAVAGTYTLTLTSDTGVTTATSIFSVSPVTTVLTTPTAPTKTLTVTLDPSSPAAASFTTAQTNLTFAKIKITNNSNTNIANLSSIQVATPQGTTGAPVIENIKIYEGSVLFGTVAQPISYLDSYYTWINVPSSFVIPAHGSKTLTISADLKSGSTKLGIVGFHPESLKLETLGLPVYGQTMSTTAITCTSFTYSVWSTCNNGTRTRVVATSLPAGCTGGSPVLSESCVSTCTSFTYSVWSTCNSGTRTRIVATSLPTGCTGGTPVLSENCASSCRTCSQAGKTCGNILDGCGNTLYCGTCTNWKFCLNGSCSDNENGIIKLTNLGVRQLFIDHFYGPDKNTGAPIKICGGQKIGYPSIAQRQFLNENYVWMNIPSNPNWLYYTNETRVPSRTYIDPWVTFKDIRNENAYTTPGAKSLVSPRKYFEFDFLHYTQYINNNTNPSTVVGGLETEIRNPDSNSNNCIAINDVFITQISPKVNLYNRAKADEIRPSLVHVAMTDKILDRDFELGAYQGKSFRIRFPFWEGQDPQNTYMANLFVNVRTKNKANNNNWQRVSVLIDGKEVFTNTINNQAESQKIIFPIDSVEGMSLNPNEVYTITIKNQDGDSLILNEASIIWMTKPAVFHTDDNADWYEKYP